VLDKRRREEKKVGEKEGRIEGKKRRRRVPYRLLFFWVKCYWREGKKRGRKKKEGKRKKGIPEALSRIW